MVKSNFEAKNVEDWLRRNTSRHSTFLNIYRKPLRELFNTQIIFFAFYGFFLCVIFLSNLFWRCFKFHILFIYFSFLSFFIYLFIYFIFIYFVHNYTLILCPFRIQCCLKYTSSFFIDIEYNVLPNRIKSDIIKSFHVMIYKIVWFLWFIFCRDKCQCHHKKFWYKVDPPRATKPKIKNENCRPGIIESVHEK